MTDVNLLADRCQGSPLPLCDNEKRPKAPLLGYVGSKGLGSTGRWRYAEREGMMIVPPRITPPIARTEFPEAIGPLRQGQLQPNVWPGMQVLLLGEPRAGFVARAAGQALPGGTVTVLSQDGHALQRLRKRMGSEGMEHLAFRAARSHRVPLPDQSADRAFVSVKVSHDENLFGTLSEIRRVLAADGRLIVYSQGLSASRQSQRCLRVLCRDAGFEFVARTGGCLRRALVFQRHDHPRYNIQNRSCKN